MTLDTLMQFTVKAIVEDGEVLTLATDEQKREFIHAAIDDLTGAPLEAVSLAAVCAACEVAKQEWREEAT
jgi:hypothetical protein